MSKVIPQVSHIQCSEYKECEMLHIENNDHLSPCEAGKLSTCIKEWVKLTNDPVILSYIQGVKLSFVNGIPPTQISEPKPINFSVKEQLILDEKLREFENRKIIEPADEEHGQFISNIFLRQK